MKIKSVKDLREQKALLKGEIQEMESLLKFENPRKSLGVITNGATEKYFGNMMDSSSGYGILPIASQVLGSSLKIGAAKLAKDVVMKKMTKPLLTKGLLGVGAIVAGAFLYQKINEKISDYQRKKVANGLNKLI